MVDNQVDNWGACLIQPRLISKNFIAFLAVKM